MCCVFFFKQKTAYEMRISDWSSDVCSSDLSRQSDDRSAFDMSGETAVLALQRLMESPAKDIKIEFQGGEPLLNFGLIQFIVREAKGMAAAAGKRVSFVITTNLAQIGRAHV